MKLMKNCLVLSLLVLLFAAGDRAKAQNERALVNIETGEILRYQKTDEINPAAVSAKWLPVRRGVKPPIDPETQRLERNIETTATQINVTWVVVELTTREIADRQESIEAATAEAEKAAARRLQIESVMQALKDGTATIAQVQRTLYEVLKHFTFNESR